MALSGKRLERLRDHTMTIMAAALPVSVENRFSKSPIPGEIATRVAANAQIVGKRGLRDQVLIILADYRDHAWTRRALASEGKRMQLADQIMGWEAS